MAPVVKASYRTIFAGLLVSTLSVISGCDSGGNSPSASEEHEQGYSNDPKRAESGVVKDSGASFSGAALEGLNLHDGETPEHSTGEASNLYTALDAQVQARTSSKNASTPSMRSGSPEPQYPPEKIELNLALPPADWHGWNSSFTDPGSGLAQKGRLYLQPGVGPTSARAHALEESGLRVQEYEEPGLNIRGELIWDEEAEEITSTTDIINSIEGAQIELSIPLP